MMKTTTIHNYDDDDDDDDDEDDDAKNDNDDNDDDYAMMMTMTMMIILHNNQPDIDNDKVERESVRRLREADGADRNQVVMADFMDDIMGYRGMETRLLGILLKRERCN
jgi:hypothetical protein